jgi:hypothetical protein
MAAPGTSSITSPRSRRAARMCYRTCNGRRSRRRGRALPCMRTLAVLVAVACLIAACSDHSGPQPSADRNPVAPPAPVAVIAPVEIERITGFRNLAWGSSEEALRVAIGDISCSALRDAKQGYGDRICRAHEAIHFGEVTSKPSSFFFRQGGLVAWHVFFSARDRDTMLAAMKQKYGEPTKQTSGNVSWVGPKAAPTSLAIRPMAGSCL